MQALVQTLDTLVPPAWAVAGAAYLLVFVRDDEAVGRWAHRLLTGALLLHALLFAVVAAQGFPPVASVEGLLAGVGFSCGAVYLWLERRIGSRSVGVFPVGIATVLVLAGHAAGDPLQALAPELLLWSTAGHVAGAILAYASILLAALFGVLFLVQRHALRARRFGLFWERLPSLELLDAFSRTSVVAAFLFLTVLIGFGHAVRAATTDVQGYWDVKVALSNLLWALAGVLVAARLLDRVRPPLSAVACVGLLLIALASMVLDPLSTVHGAH